MEAAQKIIVVDDEKSICSNVEKILKKGNYEVVRAESADEALEKMAVDSFSLLISDIVMPGKNGLELLKLVKEQWPLTKAVMMTAYASTDTAVKAIKMGALDYIPKPFTPDELRNCVEKALDGELEELKKNIAGMLESKPIDVDIPFDRDEVAAQTGEAYADQISRSDIPVVEITASEDVEGFCEMGSMVCDIFKKLGATCKAGTKTQKCPQLAKRKRAAKAKKTTDVKKLIGIDQPFDYEEVAAVTGHAYVDHLVYDGLVQVPYETLKQNVARMMEQTDSRGAKVVAFPKESTHKNILVIDDEVAVNNNIRKILAKKGFQVDQAVTKDEALERIGAHPYELILLDLKIPGVKGLELLKAIRDNNPQAKVIMITGYASIETAVEATRMGAIDYLPKPFTPDEIRNATDKALHLAA